MIRILYFNNRNLFSVLKNTSLRFNYLTRFVYTNILEMQTSDKRIVLQMDYMSVREAAELWSVSERWIQKLCEVGRIYGVKRFGRSWMIPKGAKKPNDLRKKGGGKHV